MNGNLISQSCCGSACRVNAELASEGGSELRRVCSIHLKHRKWDTEAGDRQKKLQNKDIQGMKQRTCSLGREDSLATPGSRCPRLWRYTKDLQSRKGRERSGEQSLRPQHWSEQRKLPQMTTCPRHRHGAKRPPGPRGPVLEERCLQLTPSSSVRLNHVRNRGARGDRRVPTPTSERKGTGATTGPGSPGRAAGTAEPGTIRTGFCRSSWVRHGQEVPARLAG
ncbi:uncharacterized protein LOC115067645 isoform X2 [Nannospalax galili]|uniref:uncharacterized protein LOC115067645 isoform X1 n=1 Tax=Nannospalax galili TaxID=1026970 RepID=UPI00111C180E|nr:uncharacterized protein LOC115067645 isoform X1 [Nannospalax galili]XP_029411844.1 uncharacterized protein LOC115067645 isoform X2 [Nannospalax galili]